MTKRFPLACMLLTTVAALAQPTPSSKNWTGDPALDAKVGELLGKMTLEEKVGQLVQFSSQYFATGPAAPADVLAEIKAGRVGKPIPVELYQAVADILAFVYKTHRYYFHQLKMRRADS